MAEKETQSAGDFPLDDQKISHEENGILKAVAEAERAQLLADLPDPDEGKTEEERKAIVGSPPPQLRHDPRLSVY